jgi:hypothetical protein
MNSVTYVGLDVHKTTIAVAVGEWPTAAYHHEQCTQEQPTRGVLPFPASGTSKDWAQLKRSLECPTGLFQGGPIKQAECRSGARLACRHDLKAACEKAIGHARQQRLEVVLLLGLNRECARLWTNGASYSPNGSTIRFRGFNFPAQKFKSKRGSGKSLEVKNGSRGIFEVSR